MTLFIINPTKTALIILLTVFFSIDAISQSWTFQEQHSDFDGIIYKAEVTINANTKLIVQSSDQNGKDLKVIINKKNFKHAPFDDETYLHILFFNAGEYLHILRNGTTVVEGTVKYH